MHLSQSFLYCREPGGKGAECLPNIVSAAAAGSVDKASEVREPAMRLFTGLIEVCTWHLQAASEEYDAKHRQ
jgi:hypothetical protein